MDNAFKQNMSELTNILDSGLLDRKKHWKIYQRSLKYARLNKVADDDLRTLSEVDSFFFEKWHVLTVKTTVGIPLLILAVLIIQLVYFSLLTLEFGFLIGIILFFVFSLANFTQSHVIFHWIFGIILGIRFKSIFIFKSSFRNARFPFSIVGNLMPAFGIKYDIYSFLNAEKWKRTLMLISAPPLTWFWFFINYLYLLAHYPSENLILLTMGIVLAIIFVITQALSYYGKGDFWKASRDYK